MAKVCGICGRKIRFFEKKLQFKDGWLCTNCSYQYQLYLKPDFLDGAPMFARQHTIKQLKAMAQQGRSFIDVQDQYADKEVPQHAGKLIGKCIICGHKIYSKQQYLGFTDHALVCGQDLHKYDMADGHDTQMPKDALFIWSRLHAYKEIANLIKNHDRLIELEKADEEAERKERK